VRRIGTKTLPLLLCCAAGGLLACGHIDLESPAGGAPKAAEGGDAAAAQAKGDYDKSAVPVPPPPFSEDIFPCSECHEDMDPDPTVRELDEHDNIKLHHGARRRWCFDCHNPNDRDKLRLANGDLVSFEESYILCGQCHGPKLRDWRAGVHGKRTGQWNGTKRYRLCVHCHNPHSPHFKPLKPRPRPRRPSEIK